MTNNLPCAVVRDLLPSYVEDLTSEETTKLIEPHLAHCEECRQLITEMREPASTEVATVAEVDYLKKVRKKSFWKATRVIVLPILAAAVLLYAAAWVVKTDYMKPRTFDEVTAQREFNHVCIEAYTLSKVNGNTTYRSEIAGIKHIEQSQVFELLRQMEFFPQERNLREEKAFPTVLGRLLVPSSDAAMLSSGEEIRSIFMVLGDDDTGLQFHISADGSASVVDYSGELFTAYYDVLDTATFNILFEYLVETGTYVSPEALSLAYPTHHEYAGGYDSYLYFTETVDWENTLGAYALDVATKPCHWAFTLYVPASATKEETLLPFMERNSYVLLGLMKDLEEVAWRYTCDGEEKEVIFTPEDAKERTGFDVKHFAFPMIYPLDSTDIQTILTAIDDGLS